MGVLRTCCATENGKFVGKRAVWGPNKVEASVAAFNQAFIACDAFTRHLLQEEFRKLVVSTEPVAKAA